MLRPVASQRRASGFDASDGLSGVSAFKPRGLFVPSSDARLKAVALASMSGQQIGQMRA